MKKNKRIVVFASGSGTNFISIYRSIKEKSINGDIVLLISNNPGCGAVNFAKKNNINVEIINLYRNKTEKNINNKYEILLDNYKADLILLAGFMKKIPLNIISKYKNKIMNIHPSLLPKYGGKGFYGLRVHEAVLNANEKETGVTIHFVNEFYDEGNIIKQKKISIHKDDTVETLSQRVLSLEHKLYPEVVKNYCKRENSY